MVAAVLLYHWARALFTTSEFFIPVVKTCKPRCYALNR